MVSLYNATAGWTELGLEADESKKSKDAEQQVGSLLLMLFMMNSRTELFSLGILSLVDLHTSFIT